MQSRIQNLTEQADARLLRAAAVVLAWGAAWLVVRYGGQGNVPAAGAYVVPAGLAAYLFGWHVGGATAIVSATFVGPLSPTGTQVTATETLTLALLFLAAAGTAALVAPRRDAAVAQSPPDLDEFGGVARELFTPVQAIQGAVAMLDRLLPNDGDERVALHTMARASDRLEELHELLAAVGDELSNERRAADQTMVDLRLVAGNVASELRDRGGLERMRFDAAHDADVVMGHEQRVHLMLRCLVGDALAHGSPSEPVDCSLRRDGGTVVLRVSGPSDAVAVAGRVRMVAAEKVAMQLGATFEALDAGGASQVTVRIPQRRTTDPRDERSAPAARRPVSPAEVWSAASAPLAGPSAVWSRVAG